MFREAEVDAYRIEREASEGLVAANAKHQSFASSVTSLSCKPVAPCLPYSVGPML